jgi:hypothetical protein
MKTYSLLRKGEAHPVYCEDFLWTFENETQAVGAVFDGCSGGKESHFASALIGKTLRNYATLPTLKAMVKATFQDLKKIVKLLNLDAEDELLATVLLALYDKDTQKCEILVIGDGFVLIDDKLHEIDQNNQPDYLGYHLEDDFEIWWSTQRIYRVEKPQKIAISTDGIDTFRTNKIDLPEDFNPINFLLFDSQWVNLPTMLHRKANILHTQYGYLPYDDIGVVLWTM